MKYPLGLSVDNTDHIMKLVTEWLATEKIIKVGTPLRKDSTYEKELMAALPLTGNTLHKAEMKYHGKFGHTHGRIQHISLISRLEIFYTACRLVLYIPAGPY